MFPNDDICNVRAAKSAARRIFEKYSVPPSQTTSSKGLGQQQVSGLIKNAYNAINMTYDPSMSDVSSFMSVFGVGQNGTIQLDKLEELAVKYLCGEKAFKVEQKNPEQKDQFKNISPGISLQNNQKTTVKKSDISLTQICDQPLQFKNGQKFPSQTPQSNSKNMNYKFLSPKATQTSNFFSSKENTVTLSKRQKPQETKTTKKATFTEILNQANKIFNEHKNKQKYGITTNEAPEVLTKTYQLIGKSKFSPSQEDVKIWMKLCDAKRNGIVEWTSYQNFVKRMMERESICEINEN